MPSCSLRLLPLASLAALVVLAPSTDVSAAVVGPDTFGYTAVDQDDGAVYNYVDITVTGTLLATGAETSAALPLGAPFDFYGDTPATIYANSNGFLTDDVDTNFDASNDCPLPDAPSTGAGFRIYALHDDLNTSVYYQYFTEMEATALGFPGETAGISVVQWSGTHDSGGGAVDVEAILFHDDASFLTMVAADAEEGSGSTIGIQDTAATAGLNYVCNTESSVIPGVTAVQYSLGTPPDSDCCSASPTAAPGCINSSCQAAVCDADAECCTGSWDTDCSDAAALLCLVTCGGAPQLSINEIRIDQTGADDDEFFEIVGPPGTPLTDMQYIVLGDSPTGELEEAIDLSGNVIPPSGVFVVAQPGFTLGTADLTTTVNFENTDTVTHMLVGGLNVAVSTNLDVDGDGTLDVTPWAIQFDTVAVLHPASTDLPYGPGSSCTEGDFCQTVDDGVAAAPHLYRCGDASGPWQIGTIDPLDVLAMDSPGDSNCCGNGAVDSGEDCDDSGESATCNADCTAAACGDGLVNATAGEACDDSGESETCNDDCTVAACGDGVINATAGEACDDSGESAACNDDCTAAACGDGVLNVTAGEVCDDGGESEACNDDCTAVACGDGVLNVTAGEVCDDGGESETCNDDCTAAACGDGVINVTAGEVCDDGGRSEMCNDDCSETTCGDGVVNATAGEECDGDGRGAGGETDTCDEDCSLAICGDGAVNATAGEVCDDGNTDDGDGCDADCLEEEPTGTTSTGGDETTGGGETTGADTDTDTDTDTGADGSTGAGSTSGGVDPSAGSTSTNGGSTSNVGDESSSGSDTDTDAGAATDDGGCSCRTTGTPSGGAFWSLLSLFGLGVMRRRRQ